MKNLQSDAASPRLAVWIIKRFRSSKAKRILSPTLYGFIYKHFIIRLIKRYAYADYLEYQVENSAWTRQQDKSQYGLATAHEVMTEWFVPNVMFLDIGTGDGYMLDLVKPDVKVAVGIDIHMGKLAVSACQGNASVCGDIHQLPFPDRAFDIVHMSHVLEHVISPEKMLPELKRVMRLGARILIVVPTEGPTDIKHPNMYHSEDDIHNQLGIYFKINRIWQNNTREPEFWIEAENSLK